MKSLLYLLLAIYVAVFLIILTMFLNAAKEERLSYGYLTPFDVFLSILGAAFWPVTLLIGLFVEKKKGDDE